jgi:hypothetical protein
MQRLRVDPRTASHPSASSTNWGDGDRRVIRPEAGGAAQSSESAAREERLTRVAWRPIAWKLWRISGSIAAAAA